MNSVWWSGLAPCFGRILLLTMSSSQHLLQEPKYLKVPTKTPATTIAYHSSINNNKGRGATNGNINQNSNNSHHHCPQSPGVVFCHGFRSSMTGRKALMLEQHCQEVSRSYVRFDYRGHGQSSCSSSSVSGGDDDFLELTLSDWIQDTLHVLDQVTEGPQILVGSSMGAWIAVQVALQRPDRIVGLVGVASAPDFLSDIENELCAQEKQELERTSVYYRPSLYSLEDPYPIGQKLLADSKRWLLLDKTSIPLKCPVHLLHGQNDVDISYTKSLALADRLSESSHVAVTLIKNGDHRLSESSDLALVTSAVETMAELYDSGTGHQ